MTVCDDCVCAVITSAMGECVSTSAVWCGQCVRNTIDNSKGEFGRERGGVGLEGEKMYTFVF